MSLVRVTQARTAMVASREAIAAAAERFRANGYVKLAGFVEPSLLAAIDGALAHTPFFDRIHDGIGIERCAQSGAVSGTLEFLMNDPDLLAAVSQLTSCGPIGCFEGRVYRLEPAAGHYDSWHSDVGQGRLVAMSVNLGREPFEGGALQIRRADSNDILSHVENRTAGDAVLFKIDPGLRHRVGSVTGNLARTAYAGWFRAFPDYRDLLRTRLAAN